MIGQSSIDYVVDIERLDPSGDGIARVGGRQVSIPFTIPGERVRIETGHTRGGRITTHVIEVLRASPHRVTPRCAHFDPPAGPACGGCSWQHIAYDEQRRLKTDRLTRLVRSMVPNAPAAQPMLSGTPVDDPWRYRHKVHFVFDRDVSMGHYARASRHVVPVHECPVHDDRGNVIAFALRDACAKAGAGRTLKSVAVRVARATAETIATLVVSSTDDKRLRTATNALIAGRAAPTSVYLNVHPKGDAFIFGRETRHLAGPARLREDLAGVSFL